MIKVQLRKQLVLLLVAVVAASTVRVADAAKIVIGDNPEQMNIGWMDGACYLPLRDVRVGDVLEFGYSGHNVYKMKDRRAYERCDFMEAERLADADSSPYFYEVTPEDGEELYFACKIGSHCQGQQRLLVHVNKDPNAEPRTEDPISAFALGASASACDLVQRGRADQTLLDRSMESSCTDPVPMENSPDGRPWMFTSCLSPPMTLTPGGVVNQATVLHFPYPTDRRVLMGSRIWEFVQGDPEAGVQPVYVNQLYVHHILGGVVMGNGAESIRRSDEDAAFSPPYGRVTGDFSDVMTFHLIDLRGVDQWLECVECRCRDVNGTYLDIGGAGEGETTTSARAESDDDDDDDNDDEEGEEDLAGGINCCSNCTDLTTPTVDYRLRYNVTYMDIPQDEPVQPIIMLSADIAPAVDKSIEFDVPMHEDLPENHRLPEDPTIQVLERVGRLRDLFRHDFFAEPYHGPDTVEIHRCTGHMHIGAVEQWLEDARTGEIICHNKAVYGEDPARDKGFLTSLSVQNFEEEPYVLEADRRVRIITHYNASVIHTGVMGIFVLFISEYDKITADMTPLKVDVCSANTCNASMLPKMEDISICEDDLGFFCRYLQICDCETFLQREEVTGCGGVVMTARGNFSADRFCAKTCGCKHLEREGAEEEMMQEGIETAIEREVRNLCHYSTGDCHHYLSNMYSCAAEQPGWEELDDFVSTMMTTKGRRMAMDHAKLGDRAIHRFDAVVMDEYDVPVCPPEPLAAEESSAAGRLGGWMNPLLVSGLAAVATQLIVL